MSLSHGPAGETIEQIKTRVISRGDLTDVTVEEQIKIIDGYASFELGRFLLENKGLDGFWTHYILTQSERKREKGGYYEEMLFDSLLVLVATQERYRIFKKLLQKEVRPGIKMASLPCGLMGELLSLDFSSIEDFSLVGVDLDQRSISFAKELAEQAGIMNHCQFICQDAWELTGAFDVITSNGLNIYVSDQDKLVELYRKMCGALVEGGVLVTSFLTPPPAHPHFQTEWLLEKIDPVAMRFQKILFKDILEPKFQNYLPESVVIEQLKRAGFSHVELFYDEAHIFPTIRAVK